MTPAELRIRRRQLHLTQRGLAEQLGLSLSHISHLEQGQSPITRLLELALERLETMDKQG